MAREEEGQGRVSGRGLARGRRKMCPFQADPNLKITYKDPNMLRRFITERGKIMPARVSGVSAKYQRVLCREIKRARQLALLPYSGQQH
ncbi:MAG: 30S ribosomal protein S18 [Myxococcota bacterium]|jgi:small subunit ribosomal protein S18|nr:30S ribosomal protein S18 [Myxococcales bacterium]MBF95357.1 30S ribosomal protein S18 [Myxococcales bacterium]MEC7751262.1 30S ribosomal protein S18 [Myxococcota bacterium]HBU47202.1 30S ribosomal protein S18 [Myxococcales bacterium]|tara:strand:+ start:157 stop:423 length:267 start_codon:yes stop_codon:yes gene_type:complete